MKNYKRLKRYSRFLTILITILTIFLIILVGYAIYTLYDNYMTDESSEELMSQFENNYHENNDNEEELEEPDNQVTQQNPGTSKPSSGGSSYSLGTYYKGYKVIGIISIPKLNIQYPIFDTDNSTTLKYGTAAIYPANMEAALNKQGNVVIAGHNYRNNRMFSKLHTLQNGESIYITNANGTRLEYKVYNNYTTIADDFNYATRETNGNTEISLTTCTTDASTRTIVWAKVQ